MILSYTISILQKMQFFPTKNGSEIIPIKPAGHCQPLPQGQNPGICIKLTD